MVVAAGCTVIDPFRGTAVPFMLPLTAFCEDHFRVVEAPAVIEVELALIPAETGAPEELGVEFATVTVTAFEAVVPDDEVAMRV